MHTTHRAAAFVSTFAFALATLTGCATGMTDDGAFEEPTGEAPAFEVAAPETQSETLLVAQLTVQVGLDASSPLAGPMPIVPRPLAGDDDDRAQHAFPSLCDGGYCATPLAGDLARALKGHLDDQSAQLVVPGLSDIPEIDLEYVEVVSAEPTDRWDTPVLVVDPAVYDALLAAGCGALVCPIEGLPGFKTLPVTDAVVDAVLGFDRAELAIEGARAAEGMIPPADLTPEGLDDFVAGG